MIDKAFACRFVMVRTEHLSLTKNRNFFLFFVFVSGCISIL
ncbi:hypothetical protein BOVAC1_4566 [Bacteroides ovatus]|nr:hypothetical protein BOVAC1_4566 [Bacteroides ovatus]